MTDTQFDAINAKLDEILARLPKKRKLAERKAEWSEAFTAWWKAYPPIRGRKVAADKCWARWQTKKLDDVAADVMKQLRADKASRDWTKDNGQFVPGAYKWLKGAGWEVEVEAQPDPDGFEHRNPTPEEMAELADVLSQPTRTFDEMMRGK